MLRILLPFFLVLFLLIQVPVYAEESQLTPLVFSVNHTAEQFILFARVENSSDVPIDPVLLVEYNLGNTAKKQSYPLKKLASGQQANFKIMLPYQSNTEERQLLLSATLYNKNLTKMLSSAEKFLVTLDSSSGRDSTEIQEQFYVLSEDADVDQIIKTSEDEVFLKGLVNFKGRLPKLPTSRNFWYVAEEKAVFDVFLPRFFFPNANQTELDYSPDIFVSFTSDLAPESMQNATFEIATIDNKGIKKQVPSKITYEGSRIYLQAAENLQQDTWHELTLSGRVMSEDGKLKETDVTWKFKTKKQLTLLKPLQVLDFAPDSKKGPVEIHSVVRILFDQEIIKPKMERLKIMLGETQVEGQVFAVKRQLIFKPTKPMEYSSLYTVKLDQGIMSKQGGLLQKTLNFNFSTIEKPKELLKPLRIKKVYPASKSQNISVSSKIFVTFDGKIDPKSLSGKTFQVRLNKKNVEGTLKAEGKNVTFTPKAELLYNSTYQVRVSSKLTTKEGNKLAKGRSWNFFTRNKIVYPTNIDTNLLIFSGTHEAESWVQKKNGIMKLGVTAFDEILHLDVNGQKITIPKSSQFDVDVPYTLKSRKTVFEVTAFTAKGMQRKSFTVNYGKKPLSKEPFQLITVLATTTTDNLNSSIDGVDKVEAQKNVITLIPSYKWFFTKDVFLKFKGLILREKYTNEAYQSKETAFTQYGIEVNIKKTIVGDQTYEVGVSDIRTDNESLTNGASPLTGETFFKAAYKVKYTGDTNQKFTLQYKNSNTIEDVEDDDQETDAKKTALTTSLKSKFWGLKTSLDFGATNNDAVGQYIDSVSGYTKVKLSYKFGPVTPTVSYKVKRSETNIVDPDVGSTTIKQMATSTFKLAYKPWKPFELAAQVKAKDQASNIAASVYKNTQATVQITLIY
ncbi:MAG: Ig-like domain-containing protein [SAR324 cluster bacterium]|nr:Ig-like domain-containing protein [SAR324 cluster bacterium]